LTARSKDGSLAVERSRVERSSVLVLPASGGPECITAGSLQPGERVGERRQGLVSGGGKRLIEGIREKPLGSFTCGCREELTGILEEGASLGGEGDSGIAQHLVRFVD